jgi:hypothetical protein
MIRRTAFALAVLLAAAPALALAQDAKDRTIVPGQRVGAVTAKSTPADLRKVYGTNIRIGWFNTGEGRFYGAELFADKPDYVRVYFDEKTRRKIESAEIIAEGSPWRTADGIGVGSPLTVVERANGGPVTIGVYEGEGGGYRIVSTLGGKLPKGLMLHFFGDVPEAHAKRFGAEAGVRSDDPAARAAKFAVYRVFVSLDGR